MRLREETLVVSSQSLERIATSRATLREAGLPVEGKASEHTGISSLSGGGAGVGAAAAAERLRPGENPGAEEWIADVSCLGVPNGPQIFHENSKNVEQILNPRKRSHSSLITNL